MGYKLYSNENFPRQAWPDEEVLRFAIIQERALVTMNRRHFIRLHKLVPEHQGIIVCTFDPDYVELARRIHQEMERIGSLTGRLIRINRPSSQ